MLSLVFSVLSFVFYMRTANWTRADVTHVKRVAVDTDFFVKAFHSVDSPIPLSILFCEFMYQ